MTKAEFLLSLIKPDKFSAQFNYSRDQYIISIVFGLKYCGMPDDSGLFFKLLFVISGYQLTLMRDFTMVRIELEQYILTKLARTYTYLEESVFPQGLYYLVWAVSDNIKPSLIFFDSETRKEVMEHINTNDIYSVVLLSEED